MKKNRHSEAKRKENDQFNNLYDNLWGSERLVEHMG